ncbi:hypothetical protein KEJ47_09610 [Candidatus Bathyarchaeota archaeon]|nr:hypothetical protein [Candidatus Bathyarchaeota archaeon]
MERKHITLLLFVVVLIATNFITYIIPQSIYKGNLDTLQFQLDTINSQHSVLQKGYNELNSKYDLLDSQYRQLQIDYNYLDSRYKSLDSQYKQLQTGYNHLEDQYKKLQISYNNLIEQRDYGTNVQIGNSLESYYDYLRDHNLLDLNFAAKLALHDLGRIYWPSIEKDYHDITGVYSYEVAKKKIDKIISIIGIRSYDSPTVKIQKILDFIHYHIHYEGEIDNVYHAPVETLAFSSGDCDDYSILASALFEATGIDAAIGRFVNSKNEYHSMVLVHLNDLEGYSYWYYESLTSKGLEKGRWIIIEPQSTIDYQHDEEWFKPWKLVDIVALD